MGFFYNPRPMSLLNDILTHNKQFVAEKQYEPFKTTRFPDKKLVVVTCMDTRLIELLPHAMNFRQGDVKIIKVAGGVVTHPFGSVMRSILLAVHDLGATEIAVVAHHGCGLLNLSADKILDKAKTRGVTQETLDLLTHSGIDLDAFFVGFKDPADAVRQTVSLIDNHPLVPKDIAVHGLVVHPETGYLDLVVNGYEENAPDEA